MEHLASAGPPLAVHRFYGAVIVNIVALVQERQAVWVGLLGGRGYLLIGGLGKTMEDKAWTSKKS